MQKIEPIKLDKETTDGTVRNLDALYQLFPSCFTEAPDALGKVHRAVDWGKLRSLLGEYVEDGEPEKYDFTWVGKRAAQREAAAPCRKTLRPCPEESVDWDTTQNLYIEGDNLEVLKLLQNSYMGKVKMIYIDPPYNTGNDFVYHDDFDKDYGEYDEHNKFEDGVRFWKNTDSNGRFHSDWCSMIYARLMVARSLLTEDGYICVSIDDNEAENVKKVCNEVFGESNFVAQFIIIRSEGGGLAKRAVIGHDYMIVYTKNMDKCRPLGRPKDIRGKIVKKDGEDYWIETDWFREVFGKYGTCHYEDILKFYNQSKKDEIDNGITRGDYLLIPRDGKHIVGRYRKVADDTSKFYTILKHLNKSGVADLQNIGIEKFFDYPKPVSLMKEFIQGVTILSKNSEEVILDFFSGSATTAHAVMQLNAEDGGNRKFIMVQLPEETAEDSEAYKAGYKNICEIGKERIRRAGKKIKEESPLTTQDLDTGFRVLKLDSSNMQDVYYTPSEFNEQKLFDDNIKPDRTEEDLLFQTMIELGIELSAEIEKRSIAGKTVWSVSDGYLMACFDEDVNETTITEIARQQPYYFVMRDSSLANDQVADNFEQIWEEYSKDTVRRIL